MEIFFFLKSNRSFNFLDAIKRGDRLMLKILSPIIYQRLYSSASNSVLKMSKKRKSSVLEENGSLFFFSFFLFFFFKIEIWIKISIY